MNGAADEKYRKLVRDIFAGSAEGPVYNGTMEHASVVIEEAFSAAKSNVKILTNRLTPACFAREAIIRAAKTFVEKANTQLDILIEEGEPADILDNPFIRAMSAAAPGRVDVRLVRQGAVQQYLYNFLLVDDTKYRFEPDRSETVAVVAGGAANENRAKRLVGIFADIQAPSRKIPLPVAA